MPNFINRRREGSAAESAAEIAALKQQLDELRKVYLEDMANVSKDMRLLSEKIVQPDLPPAEAESTEINPSV
jgi:hypothetical protein